MDESDEIILRAMAEFPSLAPYAARYRAAGKFSISEFAKEFRAANHGTGAGYAFCFIQALWNGSSTTGNFDVIRAMQSWDINHQRAFATWVLRPEYP